MAKRYPAYDEKNYQVTWEDLEPWAQQLREEHGVLVHFSVHVMPSTVHTSSAVVMEATRALGYGKVEEVKRDWKVFRLRAVGAVEHHALQMISLLLLEMENDKAAREASQGELWSTR